MSALLLIAAIQGTVWTIALLYPLPIDPRNSDPRNFDSRDFDSEENQRGLHRWRADLNASSTMLIGIIPFQIGLFQKLIARVSRVKYRRLVGYFHLALPILYEIGNSDIIALHTPEENRWQCHSETNGPVTLSLFVARRLMEYTMEYNFAMCGLCLLQAEESVYEMWTTILAIYAAGAWSCQLSRAPFSQTFVALFAIIACHLVPVLKNGGYIHVLRLWPIAEAFRYAYDDVGQEWTVEVLTVSLFALATYTGNIGWLELQTPSRLSNMMIATGGLFLAMHYREADWITVAVSSIIYCIWPSKYGATSGHYLVVFCLSAIIIFNYGVTDISIASSIIVCGGLRVRGPYNRLHIPDDKRLEQAIVREYLGTSLRCLNWYFARVFAGASYDTMSRAYACHRNNGEGRHTLSTLDYYEVGGFSQGGNMMELKELKLITHGYAGSYAPSDADPSIGPWAFVN